MGTETYIEINPSLYLIPLDQNLPGFQVFISSWIYRGPQCFLVDPGPAATIGRLVATLQQMGINRLDAILLTHIHIDHAGGVGDLLPHFPDTPVVVHESGIPHLADPEKLLKGSLKTLGDTARAYGEIKAVPSHVLQSAETFCHKNVTVIPTPGHAPHHVSFLVDDILFAGEAGGVFFRRTDLNLESDYLRPATPPRFFWETTLNSLEAIKAVPHNLLCYGHFGWTTNTPSALQAHKKQLHLWAEIIEEQMKQLPENQWINRCMEVLLASDPLMASWRQMPTEIRRREKSFLQNSIRGFIGYYKEKWESESS